MKTPICELCASSGVLCSGCEGKLNSGKISQLDVDLSKTLHALSSEHKLGEASFTRAVDLGFSAIIFTDGNVGLLVGQNARVASAIGKQVGKRVRIAKEGADVRQTISDIIFPAKLLGVNEIFSPDGKKFKVRISRRDARVLPLDLDALNKLFSKLFNASVKTEFE
ncbi:transcription elongation factor NusA [Candidatus Micrarchaeota archaeon]|nr:transcription elongation factor NusA [Candidatus Micrarchaeota archaeon]